MPRVIVEDFLISACVDPSNEGLRRARTMSRRNADRNVAGKIVDRLPVYVATPRNALIGGGAPKLDKANPHADCGLGLFEAHPLLAAFLPKPGQCVLPAVWDEAERQSSEDDGYEDQKANLEHLRSPYSSEFPNNNPNSEPQSTAMLSNAKHCLPHIKSSHARLTADEKSFRCIEGGGSGLLSPCSRPARPPRFEKYFNWIFLMPEPFCRRTC
ncbi:MAG: hypothetical protein E5V61_04715 [Mesorhizobium sp.]|nr:MAG: hypothetical protein E5V61_04715 [Mesorhizobium sp.]